MEYFTAEWIDAGDRLIRIGGVRGRGRGSGVAVEMAGAQVIEFRSDLISRVTLYQGRDEALRAVGLPSDAQVAAEPGVGGESGP